ncbi:hypothetical protein PTKIN_Ptkin05aG0220100 [Pterospermum kingtungense]
MERDKKERETIKHFSHPHPLVLNEEQSYDQSKKVRCRGCLEPLFGPCFSCGECDQFHLHKKCAQAPLQITHSPFHSKHPTLTLNSSIDVYCDICRECRDMFSYWCSTCRFCLDIKCASLLHNIEGNFCELEHPAHQHSLTFIENPPDELKTANCVWCQKPLVDFIYVCLDCKFYLHKKCAQLPTQLHHPSHRKHPLYIECDQLLCKICGEKHGSLFYRCLPCKFDIDIECVVSMPSYAVEDKTQHEHQFTRFSRNLDLSFVCEACGAEGTFISYICSLCNIMIHKRCISLPRFIKITRHHHNMIHNYFFQKREIGNHNCGICLREVKAQYGSYSCMKEGCNFVVHVNCAIGNKYLYQVIDPENQKELADENSEIEESSITCVMERNECGDAVKIKHFSHEEHCLMLGNKINGDDADDDKRCDGCMRFIIKDSIYYCLKCDFILHKSCAALPRKRHFWFRQSLTNLNLGEIFRCDNCFRFCSGLFYYEDASGFKCCLRCARISHNLTYEGHEHPLFFDFDFRRECNACGATCYGAFKCKDCTNFALGYECITLPQATRHKCDPHFLKLTFHDQSKDAVCDICEEERDPNFWFYHCAVCDNSAHLKCALGKYPFIKPKIGTTWRRDVWSFAHEHYHHLIFVKTFYDTCDKCGGPCQDVALRCKYPECNYISHYYHY